MGPRSTSWTAAAALLVFAAGAGSARADVIDGEWCDDAGHHFTISGPQIVTPEGTRTTGQYSRHAFSYSDPQGGAADASEIFMRLINESTVHLRHGTDATGPFQVWTRCQPVS